MADTLRGRHGLLLYKAQTALGTAAVPDTAIGIASVTERSMSDNRRYRALGSPNLKARKGGMTRVDLSFRIPALQSKAFLTTACQRAAGVLPYVTFALGYVQDDATLSVDVIQDCKVHNWEAACEAPNELGLNFDTVGGLITVATSAYAPAFLTAAPFMFYEGVVTKGGSAYPVRQLRIRQDHNVEVLARIPGVAPSTDKRGFFAQTEGPEVNTLEVTRYATSGVNMQATTIPTFAFVAAFTDIVGGMSPNGVTFTYATADFGEEETTFDIDGNLLYRASGEATTLVVS